jgi:membrane-associated HD superfamily phosphohydrolase
MTINLILSNKPSVLNKKLIKFFNLNLASLNKASLVFEFEIAYPDQIEKYISRGITNYPILINKTTKVIGVEKIIQYLKQNVDTYNKKIINKTDNDYLDEFWKKTMGSVKINESGQIDEEDDEDETPDISKKIQKAFQERNDTTEFDQSKKGGSKNPTSSSHNNNIKQGHTNINNNSSIVDESPVASLKNMGKSNKDMGDDDLMAKFFENQEES